MQILIVISNWPGSKLLVSQSTINTGLFLRLVSHVLLFPRVRVNLLQFPGCNIPLYPLWWPFWGSQEITLVLVGSALVLCSPLPSRLSSTDCSYSGSMLNKLGLFSNAIFFVHCTILFHSKHSHIAPILLAAMSLALQFSAMCSFVMTYFLAILGNHILKASSHQTCLLKKLFPRFCGLWGLLLSAGQHFGLARGWVRPAIAPPWQLQGWQWGQQGALTCKKSFLNDRAVSQH